MRSQAAFLCLCQCLLLTHVSDKLTQPSLVGTQEAV